MVSLYCFWSEAWKVEILETDSWPVAGHCFTNMLKEEITWRFELREMGNILYKQVCSSAVFDLQRVLMMSQLKNRLFILS